MIDIKCFCVNMVQENCFIVSDETRECVMIDCGAFYDAERKAIVDYLKDQGLTLRHLLCTHGHMDHVFGNDTIADAFGVLPEIHAEDGDMLLNIDQQSRGLLGIGYDRTMPEAGHYLTDGEEITFGSHHFQVIHTPGHTPGGVLFYCASEQAVFTGDTLFRMSVGRTDLPGGSWPQLMDSLTTRVAKLPKPTVVYTGHGPRSLISDELLMNPYLRS